MADVQARGSSDVNVSDVSTLLTCSVWLTYWQDSTFGLSWSVYEGVYAVLGVSQAIFTFLMGAVMGIMAYLASNSLHSSALHNIFYSPMSMFDTQPLGRILGVFGKDIDTVDNQLPDSWRMMAMTLVSVSLTSRISAHLQLIGSVIVITVYFHYFIIV
jgi:ATP-binding cassette subfamily C (CFTR/MRP) protein 1